MWFFLLFFNICAGVNCLLLNPQQSCVPTTKVKGPCHVCVCDSHGVFNCHTIKCKQIKVNPRISRRGECHPRMTYRYDDLFCICSYEGKWMSLNCRETFRFLNETRTLVKQPMRSNITCTPKSLLLVDCNVCRCNETGFIHPSSCTHRHCTVGHKADNCKFGDFLRTQEDMCICSDIDYYIDRLCVKIKQHVVQPIKMNDIAKITNVHRVRKAMTERCLPYKEYKVDCNNCICDNRGKLVCTDKLCDQTPNLRSSLRQGFVNLPLVNDEIERCTPGQKYRIRCNTCICNDDGKLSCTTIVCLEDLLLDGKPVNTALLPLFYTY